MRRAYRKISNTLEPSVPLGLHSIDIPDDTSLNHTYGDPTQPKTWKGPWRTLTDPKQIAQTVRRFNIAQYNQAHTPFFRPFSISNWMTSRSPCGSRPPNRTHSKYTKFHAPSGNNEASSNSHSELPNNSPRRLP
jgi:hypothetical protein